MACSRFCTLNMYYVSRGAIEINLDVRRFSREHSKLIIHAVVHMNPSRHFSESHVQAQTNVA